MAGTGWRIIISNMAAKSPYRYVLGLLILLLASCSTPSAAVERPALSPTTLATRQPAPVLTETPASIPGVTPVPGDTTISISNAAAVMFADGLVLPPGVRLTQAGAQADWTLQPISNAEVSLSTWVFALVAPFPTITDNVPLADFRAAWRGQPPRAFAGRPLLMSANTLAALEALFGAPADGAVEVLEAGALLETAWSALRAWAVVPFEALEPRWKVLSVGGMSPLDKGLDLRQYPLAVHFGLVGRGQGSLPTGWIPATNRDPDKMTVLLMTGVTALARGTAERMEAEGVTYPAEKIGGWLRAADLTHISNEVSFYDDCPAPERRDPRFCSDPKYIQLLESVGTDIVELTGNHLMDWGAQPFADTLAVYAGKGWGVYGGGADLTSARQALLVEDHGNRIAFLGCNPAGPETDWAGEDTPGTAPCDYPWLAGEVARLRVQGYVVVMTFQHIEVCTLEPHLAQKADFQKPADAGAAIVSGSQAHCPQAIQMSEGQFIHYGLGNLFFDQMDMFASRVMLDRHVIYNGRHISTELLTAQLEDRAQPRPMTVRERQKLLEDVFRASGWIR